ncbi:MAG: hypothetical protein SGILL_005103 [Bacillariaceae sp.]
MDYPLKVFPDGKIPVGQYEFPFALQLPESLPRQSKCDVRFEIVAEVYQQPNSVFHTNTCAKEELVVESSTSVTPHHDTSMSLPAETIPVNGCCCSKRGTMGLETKFDKTTLPAVRTKGSQNDNAVTVEFRCLNRSTERVNRVRVQLQETIEWTSNGHTERLQTVLVKADLDASQFPELDKLRKRERRRQERREYFGLPGAARACMVTLQDQPWHSVGPISIPPYAKDSYQGRAIQIRHVLSVELITKGCCTSNPDASTLMQIYRRLAQPNEQSETYASHSTHPNDPLHCSTPSAPFEDDPSMTPSAPSEFFDEFVPPEATATAVASPVVASTSTDVLVQAQVLPDDWNAQTAEVVTIPMAEAVVLGPLGEAVAVSPSAPHEYK